MEHGTLDCCPFQEAIDLLSRKHAMTILWLLQQRSPRRFNEIKHGLEVNPVTLSQRLGELEAAGVVSRTTYNEIPPRVEYALTSKGRDLLPLMDQLSAWARKHPRAIPGPVDAGPVGSGPDDPGLPRPSGPDEGARGMAESGKRRTLTPSATVQARVPRAKLPRKSPSQAGAATRPQRR